MTDHEVNDACDKRLTKVEEEWDKMVDPVSGVIRCIYKNIGNKLDKRIFFSIVLAILLGSFSYTYSVDSKTATKAELQKEIVTVNKNIEEIKKSQKETAEDVQDIKVQMAADGKTLEQILEAVKKR